MCAFGLKLFINLYFVLSAVGPVFLSKKRKSVASSEKDKKSEEQAGKQVKMAGISNLNTSAAEISELDGAKWCTVAGSAAKSNERSSEEGDRSKSWGRPNKRSFEGLTTLFSSSPPRKYRINRVRGPLDTMTKWTAVGLMVTNIPHGLTEQRVVCSVSIHSLLCEYSYSAL
jgi:hypothetical protein